MKGPGQTNELAKKSKKMKIPSQYDNRDYSSTKVSNQRIDICSSGSDGKCYGSRAIAMKEETTVLQDLMRLIESTSEDGGLPEALIKEIKSNISKGAKDMAQQWKDALELTHKAYEVTRVRLPKPIQASGWKQYEENIKHAVGQLSKTRGSDGDWRVTSQLSKTNESVETVLEGKKMKDETPKARNFVAKHARSFNKAAVMTDRKKESKAGKEKHKGSMLALKEFFSDRDAAHVVQSNGPSRDAMDKEHKDVNAPQHIGSKRYFLDYAGTDHDIIKILTNKAQRHGITTQVEKLIPEKDIPEDKAYSGIAHLTFWKDDIKVEQMTIYEYKS
jgi:hypothetical protein